jgi:MoaA/NifB/PqqE/SkfB family radical SAM enzyme
VQFADGAVIPGPDRSMPVPGSFARIDIMLKNLRLLRSSAAKRPMKKFFFSLLWDCNEDCLFCAKGKVPKGVKPRFTLLECRAILKKKRLEGFDAVSLDGGEPTLLNYLPDVIRAAADLGYNQVHLLTNAVALADPAKVSALKRAFGPSGGGPEFGVCVSLHSHERAVSEALTRSRGTFGRTVKGIKNLISAGIRTNVYHLITELNYRRLPAFADFVSGELPEIGGVTFSYVYPVSHNMDKMSIYPMLSKVAPYLKRSVKKLRVKGLDVGLSACGIVPVCLMGGCETLFTNTVIKNDVASETRDTAKAGAFPFFMEIFNAQNKTKPASCSACALNPVCGGIWKFYAELYGTRELVPCSKKGLLKLPSSGETAALSFETAAGREDPVPALMVRLLDLRYRGFNRVAITGLKNAGAAETGPLRKFAEDIGFVGIAFKNMPAGKAG